jgi:CBS domain containing-hemolysin-like protein
MDILIIVCCWGVSFLFNGIEAGLMSLNPVRLRHHVKRSSPAAVRLNRLLKRPERLLVTVLLVTNLADILALLLLTRRLVLTLGSTGFFAAVLIAFPVYLFVLAVFPKSLFRRFPFRALVALGRLLEIVSMVLWPLLELGHQLGRLILPRRPQAERARLFAAREELKQITAQSEREGSLTATERAMIHNVVDFRTVTARDAMRPLAKVTSLHPHTSVTEALIGSSTSGFDRLPVITADGQPAGLVNTLDILLDKNPADSLSHYTRRLVLVHENEPAYHVIQRLRAARLRLAAVIDRRNNLIGIVTSEDLIRRLVKPNE